MALVSSISIHALRFDGHSGSRCKNRPGGSNCLTRFITSWAILAFSAFDGARLYSSFRCRTHSRKVWFPMCELIPPPRPIIATEKVEIDRTNKVRSLPQLSTHTTLGNPTSPPLRELTGQHIVCMGSLNSLHRRYTSLRILSNHVVFTSTGRGRCLPL